MNSHKWYKSPNNHKWKPKQINPTKSQQKINETSYSQTNCCNYNNKTQTSQYNYHKYNHNHNQYEAKERTFYTNYNVTCNKQNSSNFIKILSWNLNKSKHSKHATQNWILSHNKWQLIYSQIIKQKADLIALQEPPMDFQTDELLKYFIQTKKWYFTKMSETKHIIKVSNGTKNITHNCILIINKSLLQHYNIKYDNIDSLNKWPGLILYDKTTNQPKLLLYSIHFSSQKSSFKQRRYEFNELYSDSVRNKMTDVFACIGDTNMRENEEGSILKDYQLNSCWDIIPKESKRYHYNTWHWDYHQPGNEYSLRYDRMFMAKAIQCQRIHIFDESVSQNKKHFLSDHRGIAVTIKI